MELLDAMEAMDDAAAPPPQHQNTVRRDCDFFLQQIYFLHGALGAQWARQHRALPPLRLPFAWVLSKTLRLLEEYPDGLTEAVVLTELAAQLHHRERRSVKRARHQSLDERLAERDDAVVDATVVSYAQHCVTMQLVGSAESGSGGDGDAGVETARMFLHQRFRACMAAFMALGARAPEAPFLAGRHISFTDVKLMEKKTRVAGAPQTSVLPTPYVALRLTRDDEILHAQALSFAQVDVMASQELPGHEAPSLLQELVVKARVVDISAIRPCTTPYHVQRQVVMLTDAASASQPLTAVGSHVLILWDDQVALSRLFHVGDTLTLLHPFVHVCSPDDPEMVSVFEEYSSQQRCAYYLEYGSATTLFVSPCALGDAALASSLRKELQQAEHHGDVTVGNVAKHWIGFSLYGQVAKIQVSHGIPLLAAFFYAYYDPKTQGRVAAAQRPSLDRAVVSKYYLVVLVELYDAASSATRCVELTGETAVRALHLRVGQTVFIEGLVAVDVRADPTIRALRDEHAQHKLLTEAQDERARFAFPNRAYSSPIVALSSDWESIFGHQSDVFTASRLFAINEIPGLIRTKLPRERASEHLCQLLQHSEPSSPRVALATTRFTVTKVGWLVPEKGGVFQWDETCELGYSTMLAHRACKRPLEAAPPTSGHAVSSSSAPPRWKCAFCNELFTGMDATVQTYCDLAVRLDDGSLAAHQALHAICHGDAVSVLLGVPAESFSQLSLPGKRSALRQAVGYEYHAILSRSLALRVAVADAPAAVPVDTRVDQLQPVDAFATAQALRTQLVPL